MIPVALVLIAAVLASGLWLGVRAAVVVSDDLSALTAQLERVADGPEVYFRQEIAGIRAEIEQLPTTWEAFKRESTRAESRARAVVRDARRELDSLGLESPAIEAQAAELRLVDGDERGAEGVSPLRPTVESNQAQPDDWKARAMKRKFGGSA